MLKSNCIFIFTLCILIGCNSLKRNKTELNQNKARPTALKFWNVKDPIIDNTPGISLEKLYQKKKVPKTANNIIVAVLDTQIDLNHEDLQGQLWINENEIPNNGVDDDHNGYIDDVNGWNFTGKRNGDFLVWGNFEYVRLIRKWSNYFKEKDSTKLSDDDRYNFQEYKRACDYQNYYQKYYENWNKSLRFDIGIYKVCKDSLKKIFQNEDYTYKDLDSVYQLYKINDKPYRKRRDDNDRDLGALIDYMRDFYENGEMSVNDIVKKKLEIDSILHKNISIAYNERDFIGDNPKILEKGYGNNKISAHKKNQKHSTEVSGIIAANRNNEIGIQGFSNHIKIMPLSILISADEHDKDIAMAIYYAVDKGAKVINMSFGKEFSLEQQWVTDAIKYAEEKNVLIVHVAGNTRMNIDETPYFPNDFSYKNQIEMCSNFINVGATTHLLDSTLVYQSSGYGKKNVDLFAPGDKIYTCMPDNQYNYDSGTSLAAPMVSGTAALIWLYYPTLSVQEVKQIIMNSGTSYDIEVLIPGGKGKKAAFSDLSKSGKILNVYNAMEMAKKANRKK